VKRAPDAGDGSATPYGYIPTLSCEAGPLHLFSVRVPGSRKLTGAGI